MGKKGYFCGVGLKGVIIEIFCRCEGCGIYFEVTRIKRSRYCIKSCRSRANYKKKKYGKL